MTIIILILFIAYIFLMPLIDKNAVDININMANKKKYKEMGKQYYIDCNYNVRDIKTDALLYRMLINGKEYYCWNASLINPKIHTQITK